MNILRATFVSDGSSDRMLLPILYWLFEIHGMPSVEISRPNLGIIRDPPKQMVDRVREAMFHNPCDALIIHRDAERDSFAKRRDEIDNDVKKLELSMPFVRVIPVRMSEAWLLIDENAIRTVAQKPSGRTPLLMPKVGQLESLVDPKAKLIELLLLASEAKGRRLDQFRNGVRMRIHQLAEFIQDFSPLRALPAFQALEMEIARLVQERSRIQGPTEEGRSLT